MTLEEITKKLSTKTVGIAGCGGLGSNCAVALARVGVHSLILADFDIITVGNLNRQCYFFDQVGMKKATTLRDNILRINSSLDIRIFDDKLDKSNIPLIFKDCDVVVEAFDQANQKMMLLETMFEFLPEKPIVSGIGIAGWGNTGLIRRQKFDNVYICGDGVTEIGPEMPPLAPRVGVVANMQAETVLEILLNL